MTRLIDANVLLKQSRRVVEYDEAGFSMEYNAVPTEIIKNAPTVEAVPVVRGKWIKGIYGWHCSECVESFGPELYYECGYKKPNFCPNCGVDMRGKKT